MTQCAEPESCQSPVDSRPKRQHILRDALGSLLGAIILLLIAGQFADLRRWHVNGWWDVLNDQVGYISVARNLAENGKLESNIIYTSTLKQKAKHNYLYMPGHYFLVALSFAIGGVGPVQSIAPSLIAYCIACVCVCLAARKLYGRRAGFFAAGLFALFPPMLAFAYTAMMELTLVAAAALAFCIFVYLPAKVRPYVGPALLALPFMFRETSALLVIPMAGVVLGGIPLVQRIPWQRWRDAGVLCGLSVAVLLCVYKLPMSAGRPSLTAVNVSGAGDWDVYHDTTVWERLPSKRSPTAWLKAIGRNFTRNIQRIPELARTRPPMLEASGVAIIVTGLLVSLLYGALRRDPVALSCVMMGLAAVAMVVCLYFTCGYRGLRTLLFLWPLLAMPAGALLAKLFARPTVGWCIAPLAVAVALAGLSLPCRAIHDIAGNDANDDIKVAMFRSIQPNPHRLLASTYDFGLNYVTYYPSSKWAFLPVNTQTLAVLMRKHDVGMLVIPQGSTRLRIGQLNKAGFVLDRQIMVGERQISIYRNKAKPPPRNQRPGSTSKPVKPQRPGGKTRQAP